MRIGIVTDIHDDVERLSAALDQLRAQQCDTIISLGDASDYHGAHNRAWEISQMLRDAGVIGVWGNHDFGLCRDVPIDVLKSPDPDALAYFATWQPRLEVAGYHFSHVEPWLNPEDVVDLWYFDGIPDTAAKLARTFSAIPHLAAFVGHFHRWYAGTPSGPLEWTGDRPLVLNPASRYLVVVGPLFAGAFSTLDSNSRTLTPHQLT
jgi:hypothetical protein